MPPTADQLAAWERHTEAQLDADCAAPQAVANIVSGLGKLGLLPQSSGSEGSGSGSGSGGENRSGAIGSGLAGSLELALVQQLPSMNAGQISSAICGCGLGRWKLGGAARKALLRALPRALSSRSARHVSDCLQGWGLLQSAGTAGWRLDAKQVTRAGAAVQRCATSLAKDAQAVSHTLAACGANEWQLGDAARAVLAAALQEQLPRMSVQQLAGSLGGWAALEGQLDPRLEEAVAMAVSAAASKAGAGELASILDAYSRIHRPTPEEGEAAQAAEAALRKALLMQLPHMEADEAVAALQGLARLRWRFDGALSAAASSVVEQPAFVLSEEGLSAAMDALSICGWLPSGVASGKLQQALAAELPTMDCQAVFRALQICSCLEGGLSKQLEQATDRALRQKAAGMAPGELVSIICMAASGCLAFPLGRKARNRLRAAVLKRAPDMTAEQLSLSLAGWSRLGWQLDETQLSGVAEAIEKLAEGMWPPPWPPAAAAAGRSWAARRRARCARHCWPACLR
ncbi:hypothetical protein ABPG75_010844 [Micractinium tetrahymenae]